jgi:hypothetical protein
MTEAEPPSLRPNQLPPELAAFLKDQRYACLTHATDQGTVLVLKAPRSEIESVRGPLPMQVRHELYQHPTAPVIRMVVMIYDQPARPLAFESFINVEDPHQRSDYAALAEQPALHMLFYDEQLDHCLTKSVAHSTRGRVPEVLAKADELFHAIPEDQFSFEIAKAAVMEGNPL